MSAHKLTKQQRRVVSAIRWLDSYYKGYGFRSSEIGHACNQPHESAGSWVRPKLRALQDRELVKKGNGCWFLTDAGRTAE